MPSGLTKEELEAVEKIVTVKHKVKRGMALYHTGDKFNFLYAIRTGFFKTCISSEDGREQATGFQMAGEIVGLDGIMSEQHNCDAIALEDAEVCMMPFDHIEELARDLPTLQRHMHKIMSREIVRDQGVMLLLGNMRAEERLAAFLINLTQRLKTRGFSASELILRMSREDIGSFLGMKIETVSRTFSKFSEEGLIEVKQRHVKILDAVRLEHLLTCCKD